MTRPRIVCHTHMSLDGKIVGDYLPTSVGLASQRQYYKLFLGSDPHYRGHKGWLGGRITSEDGFTHYRKPDLDETAPAVPEGDFLADPDAQIHYFSVDPAGVLGWETGRVEYFDTTAHVVEILSGKASNAYKAFLRDRGVSYIIAGQGALDLEAVVRKLVDLFGVTELLVAGGGGLNWSFVQAGLCDEVSIVLTPAADGTPGAQSLFEANERYNVARPTAFELAHADPLDDGSLWLRYRVVGPIGTGKWADAGR